MRPFDLSLGAAFMIACGEAPPPEKAPAPPPAPTPAEAIADPAPGCPADPVEMVEAAYGPYLAGDFAKLETVTCWSGETLALIRTKRLSYDPVVNAQDFHIANLVVSAVDADTVKARFDNFDTPVELTWELVDEDGWRVQDIRTDEQSFLAELKTAPGVDEPL